MHVSNSMLFFIFSLKSGGTPETRNGLLEVQKAFRDAGLDFSKQVLISGFLSACLIFPPLHYYRCMSLYWCYVEVDLQSKDGS